MRATKSGQVLVLVGLAGCLSGVACKPKGTVDPSIADIATDGSGERAGAWAVHEALEQRIGQGVDSEADRQAALDKVRAAPDDQTAAYAYARASVAGRVAEGRGLKALKILEEMRTWARRSIERDPQFQEMAATRMLGTLLVLAGQHLDGGDSEEGLELLESVVEAHPDNPVNHLRVAEAYVALGDPEPGFEHLCVALAGRAQLGGEEQRLLEGLVAEVGGAEALACEAAGEGP
ncbi:MAG TPA: hypothetical protein VK034_06365 [Enhygromyxa sp.]|nr:hypothetical protein [Enhygromyxa sp.]